LIPAIPIFEDTATMLATVPADVLVIATEPAAHADLIVLGAASGRHVICEKPLVLDSARQEQVAAAYRHRPELALVSVHQYRYAQVWVRISRWLRHVLRLGIPTVLDVKIERVTTDPHASSNWRTDLTCSGGMLADHGVHFFALAYGVGGDIELISARSTLDVSGAEHSHAQAQFGSGVLRLLACTGAPRRTTLLCVSVAGLKLTWQDADVRLAFGGHTVRRWTAASLSDREQVDGLYIPFYRQVLANLAHERWRRERTAEALGIGRTVVSMVEQANALHRPPIAGPGKGDESPQSPPIAASVNLAGRRHR
jgi:predicted dehydrogenase